MWTLMTSWCTPTTLFVVLNLMIGTIAVTSRFSGQRNDQAPQLRRAPSLLERVKSFDFSAYRYEQQPYSEPEVHTQLVRTPSLLERVRSLNFSLYGADQPHQSAEVGAQAEIHEDDQSVETQQPQLARTPSLLERMRSIKLSLHRSDPFPSEPTCGTPDRNTSLGQDMKTESEKKPAPARRSQKMKKSVSQKVASGRVEDVDAVELRRPQTVRETKSKLSETMSFGDDEEVDAKADDFINRFKQQLKLQRLDSLLRYSRSS
ncbi:hypothetical protein AAG906_009156 [Vitis piasezkii]